MDPFTFEGDWSGQLIATAIHAGHDLRPEIAERLVLDEATRLREEDPFTDLLGARAPARVVVNRSRFETDLNRIREKAVYKNPADAWGLELWDEYPLPEDVIGRSLEVYDSFFEALGERLDEVAARGPFIVLDVHSYNFRREGPRQPDEPVMENPEINLGTGSLNMDLFGDVDAAFRLAMAAQHFDVRENVKFKGQNLAWWVHERYPRTGCVLALEFKKEFMDEWTGEPDRERIDFLADGLARCFEPMLGALPK
ncbi:N-formylglutamate amidohydrolase [Tessaracoccus terricola]